MRVLARRAGRIAGFFGITSVMLPAYKLRDALAPAARRDEVRDRWVAAWCGSLLRLFQVGLDVQPPASTACATADSAKGGLLIVANHRSALDIAVLLRTFGGHMVSRADLSRWPLLGAAARSVGTVFVDRSSTTSGAGAIREIRRLLASGQRVVRCPEGTTFEGDLVRPFQAGAFIAALRTGASILPVGLAYPKGSGAAFVDESFGKHLSRMAGAKGCTVAARIGATLPILPGAHAADLAKQSRAAVQGLVEEARRAADASTPG